jgi:hypothetical protein
VQIGINVAQGFVTWYYVVHSANKRIGEVDEGKEGGVGAVRGRFKVRRA